MCGAPITGPQAHRLKPDKIIVLLNNRLRSEPCALMPPFMMIPHPCEILSFDPPACLKITSKKISYSQHYQPTPKTTPICFPKFKGQKKNNNNNKSKGAFKCR